MKKHYYVSPFVLLVVAGVWNAAIQNATPKATADTVQHYIAPTPADPNHPVETYNVGVAGGETESDVLSHLPTTIYPEDKVDFVVDPKLGLGTIVHIQRALPVSVQDGQTTIIARTWDTTVGELLDDLHRPILGLDTANYAPTDLLSPGMQIIITRVAKISVTTTEVVPFTTVTKDDPTTHRPQTTVKQSGANGVRTQTYEITREDGVEVSRKLVSTVVTTPPKPKIVLKGSKIKIGKTQTGQATWYDLCCTNVASNSFPKGTELRLTNLANGKHIDVTVEDTGSFNPQKTVVDLNPSLFKQLGGTLGQGVMAHVKAEEILNP